LIAYSDPVVVQDAWVGLFQRSGTPPTSDGQPLVVNLTRPCNLFISYTAMAFLMSGPDGTGARYRYSVLVDGQAIQPTLSPIECSPGAGGSALYTIAMPALGAGTHRIQVVAQGTPGAVYSTRNQALAVICPLQ
jgi:hypothetical protein